MLEPTEQILEIELLFRIPGVTVALEPSGLSEKKRKAEAGRLFESSNRSNYLHSSLMTALRKLQKEYKNDE